MSTTQPAQSSSSSSPSPPPIPSRQATLLDALRTIRPQDFTTFYQKPCARESLLTGIGAGFAIGGLRFISLLGGSVDTAVSEVSGVSGGSRTASTASSANSSAASSAASVKPSTTTSATTSTSAATSTTSTSTSTSSSSVSRTRPRVAPAYSSLSSRVWRSMTWAVLSFALFSAGSHVFCQRRRKIEHAAMARAAEIVGRKREEKRVEALKRREERRKEHEEEKVKRSRLGRWFGGDGEEGKG